MRQKSFIAKALLSAHNARSVVSIGVISHLCSAVCCLFVSAMNSFRIFFGLCDYIEVPLADKFGGGALGQFADGEQGIMALKNQHELFLLHTKILARSCA